MAISNQTNHKEAKYKAALEQIKAYKPNKPKFLDDPDFCLFDYSGSNIDDAYGMGVEAGLWDAAETAIEALKGGGEDKVLVDANRLKQLEEIEWKYNELNK